MTHTKTTFKPLAIAIIFIAAYALSTGAAARNTLKNKHLTETQQQHAKHRKHSKRPAPPGPSYAQRTDAMQAADEMAASGELDRDWVRRTIGQAHYQAQVARFIQPPAIGVAKNWRVYRSRFVEPIRIKAGVKFWQDNRETLARAEQETGVPAQIMVGIIGVETIFGQQMGSFRVLDALATLAFDFPLSHPRALERSKFFKAELAQFLNLSYRTQLDPLRLQGSFAGAMGMPQFMPSSWLKYAVDFDGDGKVDLFNSPADVIGSVANYFKAFNWQAGMPTHYAVSFNSQTLNQDALLAPDILPTFSVTRFTELGAVLDGAAMQHRGPLALVELQNGDDPPSYVAGTENFYAITRYNWSSYYAMAVIELGQAIAAASQK